MAEIRLLPIMQQDLDFLFINGILFAAIDQSINQSIIQPVTFISGYNVHCFQTAKFNTDLINRQQVHSGLPLETILLRVNFFLVLLFANFQLGFWRKMNVFQY